MNPVFYEYSSEEPANGRPHPDSFTIVMVAYYLGYPVYLPRQVWFEVWVLPGAKHKLSVGDW